MKLKDLSVEALNKKLADTDNEIVELKAGGCPEDGPNLSALRQRRAELLVEIDRRTPAVIAA